MVNLAQTFKVQVSLGHSVGHGPIPFRGIGTGCDDQGQLVDQGPVGLVARDRLPLGVLAPNPGRAAFLKLNDHRSVLGRLAGELDRRPELVLAVKEIRLMGPNW